METGNQTTRNGLGFIFVFALLVVLLLATRGFMGGAYGHLSNVHWMAGVLFLIIVSILPFWIVLRYFDSRGEE